MKTHGNSRTGSGAARQDRTFQDYLAIVIRGKWIILWVFSGVLLATLIVTKLMAPTYKASCQVLLNTREASSSLFLDAVRPNRSETITQNELAILGSRVLADSVASSLITQRWLDAESTAVIPVILPEEKQASESDTVAPLAHVSGRVSGMIDFDPVRESDVITITAKSKNAAESALIANTFAEAYRDRNIYLSRSKSRAFKEFLETQAREKRRSLEETESSLQGYMERQGIVSLDEEATKVIEKLAQLEATRDATEIALSERRNTLDSYREQLPQQETNVARLMGEANDPYIRLLQEQLAKLEVQRDVTVAQNPSLVGREMVNQKVKELDTQIGTLRTQLQKRTDDFLRTLTPSEGGTPGDAAGYLRSVRQKIIETQIEVQSLDAKKKALTEVISQYEVQFERIPRRSVELARLQRARLSNEKLFLMVEEKYNEANITEKSNIGYVEIIERAAVPPSPSSPKLLINLAIGIVLGLGLGLVVTFTKEYLDVRVHSPEDVKRKGMAALATVIQMDEELQRLTGQSPTGDAPLKVESHLVTKAFPFSSVAESYRQLRTNLQFGQNESPPQAILITSSVPGEGKSTTVANLGIAFAQAGKKVLLVEADLRMPNLRTEFGLQKEPGLSEVLGRKAALAAVTQVSGIDNLSLISSGAIPPNPAELLGSDAMRNFVTEARRLYDIILFDSPPVLAVTDATVVANLVEATILVVSASQTRMQELEQATELVERVGGKIRGVVINNFDPHRAYGIAYRRSQGGHYGYGQMYSKTDGEGEKKQKETVTNHG